MAKCRECKAELPSDGKFCPNCGTQMGLKKDVYHVSAGGLVGKVKEIVRDANVKRILVKDEKGKLLLSIPVTWGADGSCCHDNFGTLACSIRSYNCRSD